METSRDRILEALEVRASGLCDDCLSLVSSVLPRQQVNMICRPLAERKVIDRTKRSCPQCERTKLVNRLRDAVATPKVAEPSREFAPTPGQVSLEDPGETLDRLRRRMITILDAIESQRSSGQGFASRVSRLRDTGGLPPQVACMMLTLNALRNIVVYDHIPLADRENTVIEAAWKVIEHWTEQRTR